MALFRRRTQPTYSRPVESGVVAVAAWDGSRWHVDVDVRGTDRPEMTVATDADLAETLAGTLRAGVADLRAGVAERGIQVILDAAVARDGAADWPAALARGWRPYTVSLGRRGVVANRMTLTAEAPSFDPQLVPGGPDRDSRFQHPELSDWLPRIDGADWMQLPVWESLADWMSSGRAADPRAGAWWVPDILDPATPLAPLRESERASMVTAFLNGTEDVKDTGGPVMLGWADPGCRGRWLAFYLWRPFDSAEPFPAMIGFVVDNEPTMARCFYWPDRESVRSVAIRGETSWSPDDKRKVQGMVRELVRSPDLPTGWELRRVGDGDPSGPEDDR